MVELAVGMLFTMYVYILYIRGVFEMAFYDNFTIFECLILDGELRSQTLRSPLVDNNNIANAPDSSNPKVLLETNSGYLVYLIQTKLSFFSLFY